MSRTTTVVILGGVLGLVVGVMAVAALILGRGFFTTADPQATINTPVPTVLVETPVGVGGVPTVVNTAAPTSTATTAAPTIAATGVPTLVATAVPATAIAVSNSTVQYIQAETDVNIRSGPGTGYNVVGYIAEGQTARVTGVHSASGWWRVICPDGSTGSCWVTGSSQYTKPASAPGNNNPTPAPTSTSSVCTDTAALVADVTVPDNSQFAPNTGFNKTWRLKNVGTCTWTSSYKIVHAGGSLLGAISSVFPLNQTVAPGQTADITLSLVSAGTAGTHQSDWKLQNGQGKVFGLGSNGSPFFVKIVVTAPTPDTTIAGLVYQDWNENGVYDGGDELMANREIRLIPGTACHVASNEVAAVAYSGSDGIYTFKGNYSGNYCVALAGYDGLEDVAAVAISPGQVVTNINLRALLPNGSISGYVWNDFCRLSDSGNAPEGNCVADGTGSFRADGMIQPTEVNIAGVTVLLKLGSCTNNNNVAVSAVTDATGRYVFNNLQAATYCVYVNATAPENQQLLLPGVFTFPQYNVSYHEITLLGPDNAYSVNFGWDYQFN